MGELIVHDYCNKVKKLTDLLESWGEQFKDIDVVIYDLNGLYSNYKGLANIIRQAKPFPTFFVMYSILAAEETRLANPRVTAPFNNAHPSNLGGGGGSYYQIVLIHTMTHI